jgi:esterase/lipase superfamily enzyme
MALLGKISVREKPIGGEVAHAATASGSPVNGRREITILIHGYNNSQDQADKSFDDFANHLAAIAPVTDFGTFGFYWPGDTHLKVISTLSYPAELGPAKDSAQRLFEFLSTLSGPQGTPTVIRIVAHSLGCRLGLELLKFFSGSSLAVQVIFQSASLMAAAVPVNKAKDPQQFGNVVAQLKTQVLFSTVDRVLQFAFPIGETAAFDGFFPEAVGRNGNPKIWTTAERLNFDHGDYWPGQESATAVAAFLGAPVKSSPATNALSSRELVTPNSIPNRLLPSPRFVPQNT